MGWGEWYNSGVSLVLGLALIVMAGIPLLNHFGVISFGLGSAGSVIATVLLYVVALGGLFMLFDAYGEDYDWLQWVLGLMGVVVIVVSIIPILNQFGVIGFSLPFLSLTVNNIIFAIEGVLLLMGAFTQ